MAQAPSQQKAKQLPENYKQLIHKMPFVDLDENELKVNSIRLIEKERFDIYSKQTEISDILKESEFVVCVECVPNDNNDKNDNNDNNDNNDKNGIIYEKIVSIKEQSLEIVELEDKVTLDECSPSELIEYTFSEKSGIWYLAPMSKISLESYRKIKFANWKKMIENPTCEAAFKRLLCVGLITRMYDPIAFPSPENEKSDWEVKDDHGKSVSIPRPVDALRIWNPSKRNYDRVEAHLDGAPSEKDAAKFWDEMVNNFRELRGAEYIDNLLKSFQIK